MDLMNDSDKALLVERYSDLEFIVDITEFKCVRCGRVAITHYFSNCNHIFCKNCKNIVGKETKNKWSCPKCKTPISEITKQVMDFAIKIYGLQTHCPNKKYGCKETATLFGIPDHLKKCKETRESNLPALLTEESQLNTMFRHLEKLTEKINQLEISQQQMETNLKNTSDQLNTVIGGIQQRNAKDLEISQQLLELKTSLEAIKVNQEPMSPLISFRNEAQLTWIINNPLQDVKTTMRNYSQTSPPIKMIDSSLQITAEICFSNTIRMQFSFKDLMKQNEYNVSPSLPPLRITLKWCDQSENEPKKDIYRVLEYMNSYSPDIFASVQFQSLVLSPPYMVNNKIIIQITVDMPHLIEKPFSTKGILIWPVDDLGNKRRMLKEGLVDYYYSPHFYTSEFGFRVKIGLKIDDFNINVVFMILTGEYDVILRDYSESSQLKVDFTIFDYIPNEISASTRVFSGNNIAREITLWRKPMDDDPNSVYTNDRLVIRVKVEKDEQRMQGFHRSQNRYLKDTSTDFQSGLGRWGY